MDTLTFDVQKRAVGKSAARAIRRAGNVPCVLYGQHIEPVSFQLAEEHVKSLVYTAETHVVEVRVDGEAFRCILKDAVLHPVTDRPMHADFVALKTGEMVTITVPVHLEGTPVGQREGGTVQAILYELEVRCLPRNIPSRIEVDISEMAIGDTIHIGDLDQEDLTFLGRPEQTVVTVVQPRVVEEEEEEAVEEGEAAEATDSEAEDAEGDA